MGSFGAPNPVSLHGLDAIRPFKGLEPFKEFIGVGSDLVEPLLEVTLLHQITGAVTGAVSVDLLIGQDGVAPRAPIHWRLFLVDKAGLKELQKDGLGPPHVFRVVAADFPTPVVDRSELAHGVAELFNSLIGEDPRVRPGFDSRVFRGETE